MAHTVTLDITGNPAMITIATMASVVIITVIMLSLVTIIHTIANRKSRSANDGNLEG